nr:PREDICTED: uncharacterized protein LOC107398213 isoform X2 [Tribolium castaneum]|eukprot:XP_015837069.1 PREDICTED: uncharacterized protein LOC107398213 isoform X2 [Tribolium castaneum]
MSYVFTASNQIKVTHICELKVLPIVWCVTYLNRKQISNLNLRQSSAASHSVKIWLGSDVTIKGGCELSPTTVHKEEGALWKMAKKQIANYKNYLMKEKKKSSLNVLRTILT